jgi:hypothetical protein
VPSLARRFAQAYSWRPSEYLWLGHGEGREVCLEKSRGAVVLVDLTGSEPPETINAGLGELVQFIAIIKAEGWSSEQAFDAMVDSLHRFDPVAFAAEDRGFWPNLVVEIKNELEFDGD